jgi:hypothetical protein
MHGSSATHEERRDTAKVNLARAQVGVREQWVGPVVQCAHCGGDGDGRFGSHGGTDCIVVVEARPS